MLRKTFTILGATLAAAVVGAPAAHADAVAFSVRIDGQATIAAWIGGASTRLDLVRGNKVLATASPDGAGELTLDVRDLATGDTVSLTRNNVQVGAVPYTGLPAIGSDACVGSTAFTVARDATAVIDGAGAMVPSSGSSTLSGATWTAGTPATVTLTRALTLGEVAFASTEREIPWADGDVLSVSSLKERTVGACPAAEAPGQTAPVAPPAPVVVDRTPELVAAALTGTSRQLAKLRTTALARKRSFTLRFAAPAPGTTTLHLMAKSGDRTLTLASGSRKTTSAGPVQVTVKLNRAGRTLLRRTKRVKVTLVATFDPAAKHAEPAQKATSVTLQRR